jgi:hypothetical protein
LSPVRIALDLTLTRLRRHGAQGLNGIPHCLAALRRQLLHLRMNLPCRVFLLWSQVPEGVHAFQHLLPLRRRQAIETIELILQMLPLLRGKATELGIVL